jgi:outer membrane protein OmpA-like peptidoglycan-associated protein
MKSTFSLLLASAVLFAVATLQPPARAATLERPFIVAQALSTIGDKNAPASHKKKKDKKKQAHPRKQPPKHIQPQTRKQAQPRPPKHIQPQTRKQAQPQPPNRIFKPQPRKHAQPQPPNRIFKPQPQKHAQPQPPNRIFQPQAPKQAQPQPPKQVPGTGLNTPAAGKNGQQQAAPTAPRHHGGPTSPAAQKTTPAVRQPPAGGSKNAGPAAAPQPKHSRDVGNFIRRDNRQPPRGLEDLRRERRETREGNRVFIREGNRTIVRENNRIIIRHSDAERFAVGARNVRVEHRGDETITIIERPNGVRIINITDRDGHLIRRVRRDPHGREIVIIDNRFGGRQRPDFFVDLPPPIIHIPRHRYIIDADQATPLEIYDLLIAPPLERIERRYTVDQVRYSAPLRERMPRVDLDINFDSGSWQLTPDQVDRLSVIADALNRAIDRNPLEVFLIEGHTDAVGSPEDNLSLSDRRAEAVAVALTEEFQVPAENLVTQGYGEQYLKVPTEGPNRANRRVAIRRITPLIDRMESRR